MSDGNAEHKRRVGRLGEDLAGEFLERKGYRVIARNYRKPWGEIDIIAEKDGGVRFVEVKAVTREPSGEPAGDGSREMDRIPEELVGRRKLEKLARTAELYMESMKDKREYQIDVVGVILDMGARKARCRLFEQVLSDDL